MYIGNALEVEEAIDVLSGRTTGPCATWPSPSAPTC